MKLTPPLRTGPEGPDLPEEFLSCTQWTGPEAHRRAVSTLQLGGLYCASCAPAIERALGAVPGVEHAQVNGSSRRAMVRWDPQRVRAQDLLWAVRKLGYQAAADAPQSWQALRRQERRSTLWRLFVASFCAMQVMMMATPSYVAGPGELAPDLRQLLNWGSWVLSIPALWFAGSPYLVSAWRSVRRQQMSMDVPVAVALLVTLLGSTVATFDPTGLLGDAVYFDSLTMFLAFLWVGRYLEMNARHRAEDQLQSRLQELPERVVRVREDGGTEDILRHQLQVGDVVRVAMGAGVPADGRLLGPQAWVSEALITGESSGVFKATGDSLLAGSINQGSPFDLTVEKVGVDTRYAEIVGLMREALTLKPEVARIADRWAGPFLVTVLGLAAGAAAVWSWVDPSRAVWVAVAVLTVTCPCALSLALPATWTALAMGLARRGVLIRRLEAIETMAALRQVVFDKTGTLTSASNGLDRIEVRGDIPPERALALAVGLARWSAHPQSRALVDAVGDASVSDTLSGTSVKEVPGAGMEGQDAQGRTWRLGRRDWVCWLDSDLWRGAEPLDLWLGCNGRVVAAFGLAERAHPQSGDAVAALRALGVEVALLSGDRAPRVQRVAQSLGIAQAWSGATPEIKLQVLREIRHGAAPVGVVGDGVNDAPTLAAADVAFAMHHGAHLVRSGADAVLVDGNPMGVAWAIAGARRALRIAKQNLWWALGYNLACIPLALVGWLPPWAAGLGMAASSTWVVLNAQRAGRLPSAVLAAP